MKKIVILLLVSIAIYFLFLDKENVLTEKNTILHEYQENNSKVSITGNAAILLDAATGELLYAKNAEERIYPASTTKILTALIALEHGNLDEEVIVGNEVDMRVKNESTAWLVEGKRLSLRALLAGLMLPSGNDAARTIAIHIAKQESGKQNLSNQKAIAYFADMMNKKAKQIGAKDSHFVNPHGLHNDKHFTTAYDLSLIAREAMRNENFREIVGEYKYVDPTITYVNRNKLLDPSSGFFYKGANGIKTGFTDEAGYCLISSATRNDKELLAVVLQSTDTSVWNDSILLLDHGFSKLLATR